MGAEQPYRLVKMNVAARDLLEYGPMSPGTPMLEICPALATAITENRLRGAIDFEANTGVEVVRVSLRPRGASLVMLAKGNRSVQVTQACKKHGGFYLGSIGGPAAPTLAVFDDVAAGSIDEAGTYLRKSPAHFVDLRIAELEVAVHVADPGDLPHLLAQRLAGGLRRGRPRHEPGRLCCGFEPVRPCRGGRWHDLRQ